MARIVRNLETLATSPFREDALRIVEAGYAAVDTRVAVSRKLRLDGDTLAIGDARYPLAGRRVRFVGIGKCAIATASAVEALLGERLTDGIVLDVAPLEDVSLAKIEVCIGTHPKPSETNVEATGRIMDFLADGRKDDFVLMLVSGGGSTLLCQPKAPMTFAEELALFDAFTEHGATIQELNTVRKHLSLARGGGLAKAAYPAEVVSLIISDVPGNDIRFISSGPTVADDSTVADAEAVLARYDVAPPPGTKFIETPKDAKYFERLKNVPFLTNRDALLAMGTEAKERGYGATIAGDHFSGEAREVGRDIAKKLHDAPAKHVLLFAGESTVTLGDSYGEGGRNQELALAALDDLEDDELLLPFASDGHDNSAHAGAIADKETRAHAKAHGLSSDAYLAGHTSYDFFEATGDALLTGYTGSNVSDLLIALKS